MQAPRYRFRMVATFIVLLLWAESWMYLRAVYHNVAGQSFSAAHFAGRVSLWWDDLYYPSHWGDQRGTEFRADRVSELPFNPKSPYAHRHVFRFPDLPWPVSHVFPPFDWHNDRSVFLYWQVRTKGIDMPHWLFLLVIWLTPFVRHLRGLGHSSTEPQDEEFSVNPPCLSASEVN